MNDYDKYLQSLQRLLATNVSTEHSYRPSLGKLLASIAANIMAVNEPKHLRGNAPDFLVLQGDTPIGRVETKKLEMRLDDALTKGYSAAQMRRYLANFENLILTNYLEFRWYVKAVPQGNPVVFATKSGNTISPVAGADSSLDVMLKGFLAASDLLVVATPEELATLMANIGKEIRKGLITTLATNSSAGRFLQAECKELEKNLLPNLSDERFADVYTQTFCYGLFAARCAEPDQPFKLSDAAGYLAAANPFLSNFFYHINAPSITSEPFFQWVKSLVALLQRTNIKAILATFNAKTGREDAIVHFYEDFLTAYDPAQRKSYGVYITPSPVISYMVRSVDALLKSPAHFNISAGLADTTEITWPYEDVDEQEGEHGEIKRVATQREARLPRLFILDPATGTGSFLLGVVNQMQETVVQQSGTGAWPIFAKSLLGGISGFEFLMAPYTIAHLRLRLYLHETGYVFDDTDRLKVYLTNTLEQPQGYGQSGYSIMLAEEAKPASLIKRTYPVMVVLGNPPYKVDPANKDTWVGSLLSGGEDRVSYFTQNGIEGGPPLSEANKKILRDDYVKFIRFGQWRIGKTGHGILAFITNHGFIDNITFSGMRQSLLRTFDEIYVLNLHGNVRKRESDVDGGEDYGIFDIRQGTSINIFVKRGGNVPNGEKIPATVYYAELWGERAVYKQRDGQIVTATGRLRRRGKAQTTVLGVAQEDLVGEEMSNDPPDATDINNDADLLPISGEAVLYVTNGSSAESLPEPSATDISDDTSAADQQAEPETPTLVGGKFRWLLDHDLTSTPWQQVRLAAPGYLFVPLDTTLQPEYERGWKLIDIMKENGTGIKTHRDKFAVAFNTATLEARISGFLDLAKSDAEVRTAYLKGRDQIDVASARATLRKLNWRQEIQPYLYRPFDNRVILNMDAVVDRRRAKIMGHMIARSNIGLVTTRQTRDPWATLVTSSLVDHKSVAAYDTNSLFPLYLYLEPGVESLPGLGLETGVQGGRVANLSVAFIDELKIRLGSDYTIDGAGSPQQATFGPEDVFAYMYAVFSAPTYAIRYASLLRTSYASLPLTRQATLFWKLVELGNRLISIHLLRASLRSIVLYKATTGNNVIVKGRYEPTSDMQGRVYINTDSYFDNVSRSVWDFVIGGYQVAANWLEERMGEQLNPSYITGYQRILAVIAETLVVTSEVDDEIEQAGGWSDLFA